MRRQLQITLAREMRKDPTETEELLWQRLRRKQLSGLVFRRQYPIPASRFIADFCCPALKLIVEIDGKYHEEPEQVEKDVVREELIRDFGYVFVRVSADDVASDLPIVVEKIQSVIHRLIIV